MERRPRRHHERANMTDPVDSIGFALFLAAHWIVSALIVWVLT